MNLLTANYSSCGSRIPPHPWKKGEPFHSVLPNQVVYIAHSFGLSAFRLQCLGCEYFVRLLSAAFNINPHFVQPVDSTHLAEAWEIFILKYTVIICFPCDVCFSKSVCVCMCLSLFWFLRRSFRRYQSSAFPLTWKGTIPLPLLPCFFSTVAHFHLPPIAHRLAHTCTYNYVHLSLLPLTDTYAFKKGNKMICVLCITHLCYDL